MIVVPRPVELLSSSCKLPHRYDRDDVAGRSLIVMEDKIVRSLCDVDGSTVDRLQCGGSRCSVSSRGGREQGIDRCS
jgi:hypothetical protein